MSKLSGESLLVPLLRSSGQHQTAWGSHALSLVTWIACALSWCSALIRVAGQISKHLSDQEATIVLQLPEPHLSWSFQSELGYHDSAKQLAELSFRRWISLQ